MGWKLKRTHQCEKCPWRVETDPHDIPNGYSEDLHRGLADTIADPGSLRGSGRVMACHEHDSADEVHCVGWLVNQLGSGNNIGMRLRMLSCENGWSIRLRGEQHETFEQTLP
ncbi:DUF6283 family protein [Sphingomonas sp. DC1100-1]|uniref:DUF6283 family protein n=1 Tax=unclassified Sphingomonas TaxID=196159 RepID=UPI003CE8F8CE